MLLPPWSLHKIDKNRGIEWLSFFVYITSRQLSRYWGRYMLTPPVFMSSCEVEKKRSFTVPILSDLQSKLLIFSIFSPFIRESVRIWIQFVRSKKSMIGIVKFPVEVFLTKELQLFVWNERLKSIICIRVLLQKKEGSRWWMKYSQKLCVEAKRSQWNVMSAALKPCIDCTQSGDQGEKVCG